MKRFLFFLFVTSLFASEGEAIKRVYAHLLIQDHRSALDECKKHLERYPRSKELQRAYLKALVKNENDAEAISYFKTLEEREKDFDLIETLAWGILSRFEHSPQLFVSQSALMSALYSQDVRAAEMILRKMESSNALVRWTAVKLAVHYRDRFLIEALKRLLVSEKVWFVRLEVIRTLGMIGVKEVKETLKEVIAHPRRTAEEKRAAMTSLITIYHGVEEAELKECLTSSRSELRHLACQMIAHLNLVEKEEVLDSLLEDPSSDVRIAALNALSFLGLKRARPSIFSKIATLMKDRDPSVSLTAAWVASRHLPERSLKAIRKWLSFPEKEVQALAAHVLGKVGPIGKGVVDEVISTPLDPFVKVNLALGAIGQGLPSEPFTSILYEFLKETKQRVMWSAAQNPLFTLLVPSKVVHTPQVSQYPTMVDHLSRLELLEILAALKHPKALEAVKTFLSEESFEVVYTAASTLFEEGDEEIFEILQTLFKEGEKKIQTQAALILALSSGEIKAIAFLKEAYFLADRETKCQILAVLGRIGDKELVPFLIDVLEQPYQTLKVMAASALLQCVYH